MNMKIQISAFAARAKVGGEAEVNAKFVSLNVFLGLCFIIGTFQISKTSDDSFNTSGVSQESLPVHHNIVIMCFRACGCWPFHDTYLEPGPPQDTYIIVDDNAEFYPDPVSLLSPTPSLRINKQSKTSSASNRNLPKIFHHLKLSASHPTYKKVLHHFSSSARSCHQHRTTDTTIQLDQLSTM